jgi:hypothetical protein
MKNEFKEFEQVVNRKRNLKILEKKLKKEVKKETKKIKHYQSQTGYYVSAGIIMLVGLVFIVIAMKSNIFLAKMFGVFVGILLNFFALGSLPTTMKIWEQYEEDKHNNPNNKKIW